MVDALKQLSPKDGYIATTLDQIGSTEAKLVLELYQPLLGVEAYGIYVLLVSQAQRTFDLLERRLHKELLASSGLGLRAFYEARVKLEALGLLRTFERTDDLGHLLIYEIQAPLSAKAFFTDDLFSTLLCDSVGQVRYDELKTSYLGAKLEYPKVQEITHSLLDVYTVKSADLLTASKRPRVVERPKKSPLAQVEVTLDLEYLKDLVANSFVPEEELTKASELIKTVTLLYGLDELQIVRLLEQALNVHDNTVDHEEFKKLATRQFERELQPREQVVESKSETAKELPVLSKEEQAIAEVCKAYLPLEFLTVLKQQKNSFVSDLERYVVQNLVTKKVLPNAVINVLLHYYLIAQDNPVLEGRVSNRFTAAAAKLAENKVETPEEAMDLMKRANQEALEKRTKKKQSYTSRKVVQRETLPAWAKKEQSSSKEKSSATEKQKLDAEIDDLLAQLEENRE